MAHLVGYLDTVRVDGALEFSDSMSPAEFESDDSTKKVVVESRILGSIYPSRTYLIWFQDLDLRSLGIAGP